MPNLKSRCAWLTAPAVFVALLAALFAVWLALDPATLVANFDNDGRSPFELATLPFYAAIVPFVWLANPFGGSRRRQVVLASMVTVVALLAIAKQLDFHITVLHWLYPDYVQESGSLVPGKLVKPNGNPLTGTPFKMRVLTNGAVPFGMKAAILFYFAAFFGTFAAGPRHPVGEGRLPARPGLLGVGLLRRERRPRAGRGPPAVLARPPLRARQARGGRHHARDVALHLPRGGRRADDRRLRAAHDPSRAPREAEGGGLT